MVRWGLCGKWGFAFRGYFWIIGVLVAWSDTSCAWLCSVCTVVGCVAG